MKSSQHSEHIESLLAACARILQGDELNHGVVEELSDRAQALVFDGLADKLYAGVRGLVREHVARLGEQIESSREDGKGILKKVDWSWYELSGMLEHIRTILLYSERIYEHSVGEETIGRFGWRIFRERILESANIRRKMNEKENRLRTRMQSGGTTGARRISAGGRLHEVVVCYNQSWLLPDDVVLDLLGWLSSAQIGLVSLVSRQFTFLADFVLHSRRRLGKPFVLFAGTGTGELQSTGPFAVLMEKNNKNERGKAKMQKIMGDWFICTDPAARIPLPPKDVAPPSWMSGVSAIYLIDGLSTDILHFLSSIRAHLLNCRLKLNLASLWRSLHQKSLFWPFHTLLGQTAFSLEHISDNVRVPPGSPPLGCLSSPDWLLWALLHNILFPNCRDLRLPLEFIFSVQNALKAVDWLHHWKAEEQPRRLQLVVDNDSANCWALGGGRGLATMVQRVKQEFIAASERRQFFVEFTGNGCLRDVIEMDNALGERLLITPRRMTRLPVEQSWRQFEEVVELDGAERPVITINSQRQGRLARLGSRT